MALLYKDTGTMLEEIGAQPHLIAVELVVGMSCYERIAMPVRMVVSFLMRCIHIAVILEE